MTDQSEFETNRRRQSILARNFLPSISDGRVDCFFDMQLALAYAWWRVYSLRSRFAAIVLEQLEL